jgi:hypothetical protein
MTKKTMTPGEKLLARLKKAPKRNARVLRLIAEAGTGSLCNEFHLTRAKQPLAQLEKCLIIHECTEGDFYSDYTTTVYRAMKKRVKGGDIVQSYNDNTLYKAYWPWRDARLVRAQKSRENRRRALDKRIKANSLINAFSPLLRD